MTASAPPSWSRFILSRAIPEKHNAAPTEYVRWAALCIKLGPEIPSTCTSAMTMPGFSHGARSPT
jgi:hypothetical protein